MPAMPVIDRIAELTEDMTAWRRDLHAHPETAFEETRTAGVVADKLSGFGIDVHQGLARTGVVGTLTTGEGAAIGLRADMDALPIFEANDLAHKSTIDGKMHACGHDGHTAMLLGAARYLSEIRNFTGTVHFIFQPAEESEGGGREMVEDGLFDLFPMDRVFGLHNWPEMEAGTFAVKVGPMMAAFDVFELTVTGRGAHAAMPHLAIDPIPAAADIVGALRALNTADAGPERAAVVTVTQIHGGDAWNVIPDRVTLRGTARSFDAAVQDGIERSIGDIAGGICERHGCGMELDYQRRYPATVNDAGAVEAAVGAAVDVAGPGMVVRDPAPSMVSEDFAFMLNEKPGCYAWIGNGGSAGGCLLHNPGYDFNDHILGLGASYWARLVERELGHH